MFSCPVGSELPRLFTISFDGCLWSIIRIKEPTPRRSFSCQISIDWGCEGDFAQRRSKQVELAQSIEDAKSPLVLFFKQ